SLLAARVQDGAAPGLRVQLEEAFRAEARLPQNVVHVVLEPRLPLEDRRKLLEQLRSREGRQDRVPRPLETVFRDEVPELPEMFLRPVRVDEEVSRDPVSHRTGDRR